MMQYSNVIPAGGGRAGGNGAAVPARPATDQHPAAPDHAGTGRTERKLRPGFIVLLVITTLLYAALLELGKNTLWGWGLALLAACAFVFIRLRFLAGKRRLLRFAGWVGFLAVLALIFAVSQPPYRAVPAVVGVKTPAVTDIVTVKQGQLTGVYTADGAVEVYTGIPYAAPPVGENRWREPQEPEPWEGVRVCDHFAPMSMQTETNTIFASLTQIAVYHTFRVSLKDNWLEPRSEDSLYLNVWKPEGDVSGLPVLVYIHGGSLTSGQPSYNQYNGEALARKGIVVVNFAYRLNVFGYYASEELAAESPNGTTGNYGLLDQIAALRWVQENISAFGGDPDQVTICGESAGASSVNALCVSPLSEGLFRRAIAESSGITAKVPYHTFRSFDDALKMGKNILSEFGASIVEDLRSVPAEQLVNTRYTNNSMTVDGYAITEQPYLTYLKGENHEEALLGGFNAHEADLFALFYKVDEGNYVEMLSEVYGDRAAEAAALCPPEALDPQYHYVVDQGGSAKGSFNFALSATWFTYSHYNWSRLLTAQGRPCWEYYFTKDNGSLGSCHAGELPYAFGDLHWNGWLYDEGDAALSEIMQEYWVNFVKYGDPNGAGVPDWPRFAEDPTQVLELGAHVGMITDPYLELYGLIDQYQDSIAE